MFCRYCGREILDAAVVCVGCGCPPRSGNAFCARCGAPSQPAAQFCLKCGGPLVAPPAPGAELKSKLVAGLLGIFLGGLGVHRFYLGFTGIGVAQILVSFFTCGLGAWWGFIEGILILAGSMNQDAEGRPLRD